MRRQYFLYRLQSARYFHPFQEPVRSGDEAGSPGIVASSKTQPETWVCMNHVFTYDKGIYLACRALGQIAQGFL